jgi:hypothetical protein
MFVRIKTYFSVIARSEATRQSSVPRLRHTHGAWLDCFALLAMTGITDYPYKTVVTEGKN